jgi:hypothetical protein
MTAPGASYAESLRLRAREQFEEAVHRSAEANRDAIDFLSVEAAQDHVVDWVGYRDGEEFGHDRKEERIPHLNAYFYAAQLFAVALTACFFFDSADPFALVDYWWIAPVEVAGFLLVMAVDNMRMWKGQPTKEHGFGSRFEKAISRRQSRIVGVGRSHLYVSHYGDSDVRSYRFEQIGMLEVHPSASIGWSIRMICRNGSTFNILQSDDRQALDRLRDEISIRLMARAAA